MMIKLEDGMNLNCSLHTNQLAQFHQLMSAVVKYFSWSIPRFKVMLAHIANQERCNNGFNGQTHEEVLMSDITFYNTQQEFESNNINKRNLVGGAGIDPKVTLHDPIISNFRK